MRKLIGIFLFMLCCLFTNNINAAEVPGGVYKQLPKGEFDADYFSRNAIYPSEKQGGFYYVKAGEEDGGKGIQVMFCDAATVTTKKVLSIPYQTGYYKTGLYEYLGCYYYANETFYYLTSCFKNEMEMGGKRKETYTVHGVNLVTGEEIVNFDIAEIDITEDSIYTYTIPRMGVDSKGRVYIANFTLKTRLGKEYPKVVYLYSSDGKLLSVTEQEYYIAQFLGFDPVNGNFYFEGSYNWRYWGYDHDMASLQAGNVTNDVIRIKGENITIQYQKGFYFYEGCAEMISDRYLADLSPFSNDSLAIIDSNAYDYTDVAPTGTKINIMDSSVSVDFVAVNNASVVKFKTNTFESDVEPASTGTRCVYNPANGNVIVATDRYRLTEYDMNTGEVVATMPTESAIYKVMRLGNTLVILEMEDEDTFYVETCKWIYPTQMTISGPATVAAGDAAEYITKTNGKISCPYTFRSSDSSILSIDEEGEATAWKAGTVVVSVVSDKGNIQNSMTVTVTPRISKKTRANAALLPGVASANRQKDLGNDTYGSIVNSYLVNTDGGGLMRVEYIDPNIIIENYSAQNTLLSSKIISPELPLFGGFFAGKDNYYLVYGKTNKQESDKEEVVRVVKYSKDWQRISDCKISGINTRIPFDAGSLRMTETDDTLYIHTCHEMYESEDGYNHQANMTFAIDKKTMQMVDSYTDVMNISHGYVSHSFNQFINADGKYVYRADHGDSAPCGVAITAFHVDNKMSEVSYSIPLRFGVRSGNETGATLGGMEISNSHVLVAGNYGNTEDNLDGPRNIFVIAADLDFEEKGNVKYITNYVAGGNFNVGQPKLVKIDDSHFLLMWREENIKTSAYTTKLVQLDGAGNKVGDIITTDADLSDCQPILLADGTVSWYVTNDSEPVLYNVDPFDLTAFYGSMKIPAGSAIKTSTGMKFTFGKNKTATLVSVDKSIQKCTVPDTVKYSGKTYKVTKIKGKAFANCKSLKQVTLGKNVKTIGANVFKGCKNLKKITIKSTKLTSKSVKKKAFKGISKKAVVKVPKNKVDSYKKLLRKKGLPGKVKVKGGA